MHSFYKRSSRDLIYVGQAWLSVFILVIRNPSKKRYFFLLLLLQSLCNSTKWRFFNQQNLNNCVQGLHPAKGSCGKQTKLWLWTVFFCLFWFGLLVLFHYYKFKVLKCYCFTISGGKLMKLCLLLVSRFLQFSCIKYLLKMTTYSILKTEQHKLHLTDTMAVKV